MKNKVDGEMYPRVFSIVSSLLFLSLLFFSPTASVHAAQSYCPNGPLPSVSGSLALIPSVQQCSEWAGCSFVNNVYYATLDTANNLAGALGASVVTVANPLGDPQHFTFSSPEYELSFPDGYEIPAGYVATNYANGSYPDSSSAASFLLGVCGSSSGGGTSSGGTTGGTTRGGTGGGTTGGTTGGTIGGTTGTGGTTSGTGGTAFKKVTTSNQATLATIKAIYTATQATAAKAIAQFNQLKSLQPTSVSSGVPETTGSSSQSSSFPVLVTVNVVTLHVRSAPNTSASLSGSQTLTLGDTFTAVNEVAGESVSGNNMWWVSSKGNYIWSGGASTSGSGSGSVQAQGSSVLEATTQTVTSGGVQYSVDYSYLASGEERATFTYQNQVYVVQNHLIGSVDASGVVTLRNSQYFYNIYGPAGSQTFLSLVNSIQSTIANISLGVTFSTPPDSPAGVYKEGGLYPVHIMTDANGNLLYVYPVANCNPDGSCTAFGSSTYWYNIGNGYGIQTTTDPKNNQLVYIIRGGAIPGNLVLVLQNAQVAKNSAGLPLEISGQLASETTTQLSKDGYADLVASGGLRTFAVGAHAANDYSLGESNSIVSLDIALDEFMHATTTQEFLDIAARAGLLVGVNNSDPTQITIEVRDPSSGQIIAVAHDDQLNLTSSRSAVTGSISGQSTICSNANGNNGSNLFVDSDGKVYGINNDYNITLSCESGNQTMCNMVSKAVDAVVADYNSVTLGPQGTRGGTANSQNINVTYYTNPVDSPAGRTTIASAFQVSVNGDLSNNEVCNIGIYQDNLAEIQDTLNLSSAQLPKFVNAILEHEMGHCFGFAHNEMSYIMTEGGNMSHFQAQALTGDIPVNTDQTNMALTLQELKSKASINGTNCQSMAKLSDCSSNETYDLFTEACVPIPPAHYNCSCNGGIPFCTDDNGQDVSIGITGATPYDICPSAPPTALFCACLSSGLSVCQNSSLQRVDSPQNFCPTDVVPAGEVCTCFNGNASCINTDNVVVSPPATFSCSVTTGSTSSSGGYSCNANDQCVYDSGGGQYSDSSCDNQCGSSMGGTSNICDTDPFSAMCLGF